MKASGGLVHKVPSSLVYLKVFNAYLHGKTIFFYGLTHPPPIGQIASLLISCFHPFRFFRWSFHPNATTVLKVPLSLLGSPMFPPAAVAVLLMHSFSTNGWVQSFRMHASLRTTGGSQSIDPWPKPIWANCPRSNGVQGFCEKKQNKKKRNQLKTRVNNRREVHKKLLKLLWSFWFFLLFVTGSA